MAGIKEIRTRITSVQNTSKITSAMKLVSAAKLRKAQTAVQQMRPYADKLSEILANISSGLDTSEDNAYAIQKEPKKVLIIAIASNSGLCGGFNSNIVKQTIALSKTTYKEQKENGNLEVFAIGKKTRDLLKSRGLPSDESDIDILNELTYDAVAEIASEIMAEFVSGGYDKVELVYNQFKNAATQIVTTEQFLPIVPKKNEEAASVNYDYIFEPSEEYIVNELIPQSLKMQFYSALLESVASEHGARMTAMHAATDNASILLKDLQIEYNKARQASITNEILEIVSGANALNG